MSVNRGRGGGHAPPPRWVRGAAAAVLLACAAVVGGAARPADAPRIEPRKTPFPFAHEAFPSGAPEALVYLSDGCPWCRVELDGWAATLRSAPQGTRVPWMILAPGSDTSWVSRTAPGLGAHRFLDADGSMARAMGVGAVPFLLQVAPDGTATRAAVGRTTSRQRAAVLRFLNPPTPETDEEEP